MTTGATKPDWDTPPDGDFAAYVERLTAQKPLQKAPVSQAPAAAVAAVVGPTVLQGLLHALQHGGQRFPTTGNASGQIGSPGIDVWAGDLLPGPPFPAAKVHFLQAGVGVAVRCQSG